MDMFPRNESANGLVVLVDPDKIHPHADRNWLASLKNFGISRILIGGSLETESSLGAKISMVKSITELPIAIFPGSIRQISTNADAFLLLSLVSGRNPDYLIGQHVHAAMALKQSGLEIIPTAYILVEGGCTTTAHYITQTIPIPHHKPEIAAITALAASQLGMKLVYLDSGSGANLPVSIEMVKHVRSLVELPIVVGGGISNFDQYKKIRDAGADWVVVGTAIERNPKIIEEFGYGLQNTGGGISP